MTLCAIRLSFVESFVSSHQEESNCSFLTASRMLCKMRLRCGRSVLEAVHWATKVARKISANEPNLSRFWLTVTGSYAAGGGGEGCERVMFTAGEV